MTKTQELLIRIFSTVLFVPFLIFSLFYEKTYSFPCIIAIAIFWGLTEFYTLARKTNFKPDYCVGFVLAFVVWYYTAFDSTSGLRYAFPLLWIALLVGFFYQLIKRGVELPSVVANIGITVLGIIYIAWPFSLLIEMQRMENGGWYLLWLIFVTWFCDIGAYLVGSRIGKHKLCPHISPGKTIEGLIGGILFSVIIALVLDYVLIGRLHLKFFNIPVSLLIAAVLILIGTAGDLAESVMKRQAGVKDSGNTYTGHGGMLDIVDSLLFTIPIYYYLFKLLV